MNRRLQLTLLLYLWLMPGSDAATADNADLPHLQRKDSVTQLIVDGKPFIMLAGELHNSSASSLEYMQTVWPRLGSLHLNTVLASVSWELIEPEEGKFDFDLVDGIVRQAREHDMKLVLLWFGSWKNGVSSYAPAWVKSDTHRFPRSQGSSNHNTKSMLSPHYAQNEQADAHAFATFMRHLKQIDGEKHTVVMIQVENEVGIKPELRDTSPTAEAQFNDAVAPELLDFLSRNKERLIPELRATWEKAGGKTAGNWTEVFGSGPDASEIFSAWYYARYINGVAAAGKAECPLPMYVNAWIRQPEGKPGQYPTGGPVAHMMDIWRAAGSSIDLLAPDIYLPDFKGVCSEFTQQDNPLFIPEANTDDGAIARAFWAIGAHDALGFSPFGIDGLQADHPLGPGYQVLGQLMPFITSAEGSDRLAAVYQQDRNQDKPENALTVGGYRADVRFSTRNRGNIPAYGLIINTADDEFLVAGHGFDVHFSATTPGARNTEILSVEMGHFEHGQWVREMRLNGDETAANYLARIPPNDANPQIDPSIPRILKIKLYRFD